MTDLPVSITGGTTTGHVAHHEQLHAAFNAAVYVATAAELEAAMADAITNGETIYLAPGTYEVENLTATGLGKALRLVGSGVESTTLKLQDDDAGGGNGQILVCTDLTGLSIKDMTIDGNNVAGKASTIFQSLVLVEPTVASAGRTDIWARLENVTFTGAQGGGQFRVKMYDDGLGAFSYFDHVHLKNCHFNYHTDTSGCTIRGPGRLVDFDKCSARNDGQYGFTTENALDSNSMPFAVSTRADTGYRTSFVRQVRGSISVFRCMGAWFGSQIKNLDLDIDMREICINPYWDSSPVVFTSDYTTNTLTAASAPTGFNGSGYVQVSSTGTLPGGLTEGNIYSLENIATLDFELATSTGAGSINLTDDGTGTHTFVLLGNSYTTAIKGDDVIHTADDPVTHVYRVNSVNQSPQTGSRDFSWESSIANEIGGKVILENSSFEKPVIFTNLAEHPDVFHEVHSCLFGMGAFRTDVSYGTGAPLTIDKGTVTDCYFGTFNAFTVDGQLTFNNCQFESAMSLTSSKSVSTVHVVGCEFGRKLSTVTFNVVSAAYALLLIIERSGRTSGGTVNFTANHAATAANLTARGQFNSFASVAYDAGADVNLGTQL
jgi:hypothetical protein